jgi:hypothetical protein
MDKKIVNKTRAFSNFKKSGATLNPGLDISKLGMGE